MYGNRMGVAEGFVVRTADGEKLGKVKHCDADAFVIGKGFFFPQEYTVRYDQVADVRDREIWLNQAKADFIDGRTTTASGIASDDRLSHTKGTDGLQARDSATEALLTRDAEETRLPLMEEELEVRKVVRETGRVQVRKDVVAEDKQVSVPVMREEVRVERIPAGREAAPALGDSAWKESTVSVPVREEEVEVVKRPVVREELRISRTPVQEKRTARETVKREIADVDTEGSVRRLDREDDPDVHR
jgi:uncharacterized protein (TIGR02271 family)